ncbi:long-chain-fatty-acid--CoA ligase ACSBG2 isoform X2 [Ochotona princeps]|uniref:long-chain-fatty-acid--CoA ligase ACSBG2-like isoform X2 n=1 Tax=Ochotona princeps TaxID=9978 RepID=UPI002714B9DA|nr:long-chain-fatty-acid--CoA ligase ACSBG2-like isoform X2 [Ochotona princeps]XP_058515887.1 long-chain-fatty-acid--CoA ligase ACSBG2 isoform X2 [Ochotona princeps]
MKRGSTIKSSPVEVVKAEPPVTLEEEPEDHGTDTSKPSVPLSLWTTEQSGEVLLRLSKHGPGHETPMTIPEFFRDSVNRFSTHPALASKNGKKWETLTFTQYYEACRKAARSLIKLGLQRFHAVGILGFNSMQWFIAALGAILAGGLCVGIYATNSADACQYVITQAKVNVLLVENDQQLRKILSIPESKMETLKAIIQYRLPMRERNNNLYSWDDFMELGNSVPDLQLDRIIESQKANQCAVIIYTSGTMGNPKGVMLSHDNITWLAGTLAKNLGLTSTTGKQEAVVSYLPLSHIAAQMMDIWLPIKVGGVTYFAQTDALKGSLIGTLQEVKPTAFLGVPRIWEKMQETIRQSVSKSSSLKKKVFSWAKNAGLRVNTRKMMGKRDTTVSYRMAKALVFSKVRSWLGLDHCRYFISGAASLSSETSEFFLSLDIPIGEMYGLSESSGPHTVSTQHNYRLLSCGKVLSGCKTMVSQQNANGIGEVCLWGRHVFMGYLDMEDATTEAIDEDGWLHTGDLGRVDSQSFLYITGRIKEILITAGGENVSPVPIETLAKQKIPIISHAVLVGDKAKFLSMLLTLKQGIDAVNAEAISNAQKIRKWLILEKDFSIVTGELGPTTKIKRHFINLKYRQQIESLYQ